MGRGLGVDHLNDGGVSVRYFLVILIPRLNYGHGVRSKSFCLNVNLSPGGVYGVPMGVAVEYIFSCLVLFWCHFNQIGTGRSVC